MLSISDGHHLVSQPLHCGILSDYFTEMFNIYFAVTYTVFTALYGVPRSLYICNLFPISIELAGPKHAVTLFMLLNMVQGVGGLISPYIICEYSRY